jgi:chromosome segregation ATPase
MRLPIPWESLLLSRNYMKTLIFGYTLTVHLPEAIIGLFGAIILGFTLHYFWTSRHANTVEPLTDEVLGENEDWKLKYYNDMEIQEKAMRQFREKMAETEKREDALIVENRQMKAELDDMDQRLETAQSKIKPLTSSEDYLQKLAAAQEELFHHNQTVNRLLQQNQLLKESEKKSQDLVARQHAMNEQITSLHRQIGEKDAEIQRILKEQKLVMEMNERMDQAIGDFNSMREKLRKLESALDQPHSKRIEYEQLQEAYFKMMREFDEVKGKQMSLFDENQRLSRILADTEDKLKEANFQRQQYHKKMLFMEELNRDLTDASEQHKKMESQLRRIAEMESIVSRSVAERRDPPVI